MDLVVPMICHQPLSCANAYKAHSGVSRVQRKCTVKPRKGRGLLTLLRRMPVSSSISSSSSSLRVTHRCSSIPLPRG